MVIYAFNTLTDDGRQDAAANVRGDPRGGGEAAEQLPRGLDERVRGRALRVHDHGQRVRDTGAPGAVHPRAPRRHYADDGGHGRAHEEPLSRYHQQQVRDSRARLDNALDLHTLLFV